MAEEDLTAETQKKSGSKVGILFWLLVAVIAIGGGFATPIVIAKLSRETDKSHSGDGANSATMAVPDPNAKSAYIDFDEVVVNLNDPRFSRFLKVSFSLQVAELQKTEIEALVTQNKAILTNWLIAHIADKKIEDVRGKFGHNRLRREIHDVFNSMLFKDGIERIQDVLLKELNVQ